MLLLLWLSDVADFRVVVVVALCCFAVHLNQSHDGLFCCVLVHFTVSFDHVTFSSTHTHTQ